MTVSEGHTCRGRHITTRPVEEHGLAVRRNDAALIEGRAGLVGPGIAAT